MTDVASRNFGLLIAYLLPGFVLLLKLAAYSEIIRSWLRTSSNGMPTVGGFAYVTLTSVALGLTVSAIRWVVLDPVHHRTGVHRPSWDFSTLQSNLELPTSFFRQRDACVAPRNRLGFQRSVTKSRVAMPFPPNRFGPDPRISSRRAARLYRLVTVLSQRPRGRTQLIRLGRAGMRTFYRDLIFLADFDIVVQVSDRRYQLVTPVKQALHQLPFPPPKLTFGDVLELSKGRTAAHAKLRAQLKDLIG